MTVRQTGPNQRRTPLAHLYSGSGLSAYLGEERIMATDLYQQLIDNGWEPDEIWDMAFGQGFYDRQLAEWETAEWNAEHPTLVDRYAG